MFLGRLAVLTTLIVLQDISTVKAQSYKQCSRQDCSRKNACVTIYQHPNWWGWYQCLTFRNNECTTLNSWWISWGSRVSGADSHNTCVRLYTEKDCTGNSLEISPSFEYPGELRKVNFEDKAQSVSSCSRVSNRDSTANSQAYGNCTQLECSTKQTCATIYRKPNFSGWRQCLTFQNNECISLNSWWTSSYSRLSSINTHGTCIRLFYGKSCTGLSLEFKPGYQPDTLNKILFFEDKALSVSSCNRPSGNMYCYIRFLFSKHVDSLTFTVASGKILKMMDKIVSFGISELSAEIPGLSLLYSSLKAITGLFNTDDSTAAMIDAKIEQALVQNAASQLSAKMHVIENRLETVLSNSTIETDKRYALLLALHTSQELQKLFQDNNYVLFKNKLVSSPYLVAFSSVYLTVAKFVYEIRPEMRQKLTRDMKEMAVLNEEYMEEAKLKRMEKFSLTQSITNGYYSIVDNLDCEPGQVFGNTCYKFRACILRKYCVECLNDIANEVESFFQPVIDRLAQFPL